MAEILGLGISHYPPLSGRDEDMANILKGRMLDPDVPAEALLIENWPEPMRAEWGDDEGRAAAAAHRSRMVEALRRARAALDEFQPDLVVLWGDDQYENFREDIIPPFCVMAYDDMEVQPWAQASQSAMFSDSDEWGGGKPNVWGEKRDVTMRIPGNNLVGRQLTSALLANDFDVAYAYRPLHHPGLPHAFLNSILYLDYDRKGWPWPVLPFQINCYGSAVISYKGYISKLAERGRLPDPPSPSPRRLFALGAAVARYFRESDLRVALVASSSWSHAFLNDATYRMRPDVELDRKLYQAMVTGDYDVWKRLTVAEIEASGEQELLNWCALLGAMEEIGGQIEWSDCAETWIFNSTKVGAVFSPA